MWRTTWKGMWSHKRRLIGTTMAVLLGVAFLTTSLAIGSTMTAGFDDLFSEANAGTDVVVRNANVIGSGDSRSRGNLDAELVNEIDEVDGVASAVAIVEGSGRIVGSDGTPIGGGGPPTTAANGAGDSPVNPWQLADGRAPTDVGPGAPYEVVIDRASAITGSLDVGDETVIRMPQPVAVTIVGVATFGGADSSGPTTYAAFTDAAAAALVGRPGEVSAIRIAADDGVSQDELRDDVVTVLPADAEALTGNELTDEMMAEIEGEFLGMFKTILLAFAVIALVVASFSIHNTFSILIAQRSRESALLRALGASRRQVLTSVVGEAIAIGVVASVAGIAAGYGLAVALKAIMDSAGFDLGFDGVVMATSTLVIAMVVGIASTLLASVVPAVRASRIAPLAALRDSAVDSTAASTSRMIGGVVVTATSIAIIATATSAAEPLVRAGIGSLLTLVGAVILGPVVARPAASVLGWLPTVLRGQTGRLARRNAMRDPRRTSGSALALMIGTAVVALFTTFGASIKASVEQMVNQDFGGDLVIVSDDFSGPGLSPLVADEVAELPEVAVATGMAVGMITANGNEIDPAVVDAAEFGSLMDLGVSAGSFDDVTVGNVALSEEYAADHDLAMGSVIDVAFADGASTELTVAAIYGTTQNVGDMIVTPDDWMPHADQLGHVVVLVGLADGVAEADGLAAVDAVTARNGAPDAQTRSEYVDSLGSEIDQMLYFVYGMLGLAVVIALMGIANTLSLSIHERTRELGLLRAVGQTRREVRSTVRWESVIVAVFGTIGGIGLGVFLGWGLMRALVAQEGFGAFAAPIDSLAVVLVLAALAGVVAAWRPSRRAGRLDILSAIATD